MTDKTDQKTLVRMCALTNKQRMRLIEGLTMLWDEFFIQDTAIAQKLFDDIYKVAHLGFRCCKNKHKDWDADNARCISY